MRDAVERVAGLELAWDNDESTRGNERSCRSEIRERPALVVLNDAEHPLGDVFWLGSVYLTMGRDDEGRRSTVTDVHGDLSEDDEPVAKMAAAFAAAEKSRTQRPVNGRTEDHALAAVARGGSNTPNGNAELVSS